MRYTAPHTSSHSLLLRKLTTWELIKRTSMANHGTSRYLLFHYWVTNYVSILVFSVLSLTLHCTLYHGENVILPVVYLDVCWFKIFLPTLLLPLSWSTMLVGQFQVIFLKKKAHLSYEKLIWKCIQMSLLIELTAVMSKIYTSISE